MTQTKQTIGIAEGQQFIIEMGNFNKWYGDFHVLKDIRVIFMDIFPQKPPEDL